MIDAAAFHELASGQRRGVIPAFLRGALWCAQAPYGIAVAARNRRYDRSHAAVTRVGAPVVSIGNLTVGGSGKTPMVKWVARKIEQMGLRPGLVSRGYGADGATANDEARELAADLPTTPHVQNPDRVAAAREAIDRHGVEAIIMDDGFQHRRLARDLDIVLVDATSPWGYGWLLPRGALREPLAALGRADVVCLTRRSMVDTATRDEIRDRVKAIALGALWCEADHAPVHLVAADGTTRPCNEISGKRVAAFCGIGNPAAFFASLESVGASIAWRGVWPDHHRYTDDDAQQIADAARSAGTEAVVCTRKDLVKFSDLDVALPVVALAIEMQVSLGGEELAAAIRSAVLTNPTRA